MTSPTDHLADQPEGTVPDTGPDNVPAPAEAGEPAVEQVVEQTPDQARAAEAESGSMGAADEEDGDAPAGDEEDGDTPAGDEEDGDAPAAVEDGDAPAAVEDGDAPAAGEGRKSRRVSELEREGEIAADFLETLLDIADLDGDLEVDVDGDRAAVAIVDSEDGAVPRRLVGPGASVLEALQELTRLAVQAETGDRSRLMLDVASYRADRKAALVEQARRVIDEVRSSGERRELEPMTAFERKVVHDQVLAAGLLSESEGEEPHRFVVVLPS